MSNRYISRRRFLTARTPASAGFAIASTDALRSWAAHPRESIDAIVIGSSFGGAVAALRLAQARGANPFAGARSSLDNY